MWFFGTKVRAEPEMAKESSEDSLLRASLQSEGVTVQMAMNVPTFSACVNKISEIVSTVPIRLYKKNNGILEEITDDARTRIINSDTGDTLDAVQFKRAITKDYLIGKGGYAFIEKKGSKFHALRYVSENEISFMYGVDPIYKDYEIMIQGKKYMPHEFLKILRNSKNGWSGTSVIEENKEVLSVAYHSLMYEKNLVKTGGNKKGFLKAAHQLDKESMKRLRSAWNRLYQNNTENVIVLNNGLDFQEASNTSVEMQLNENKKSNSDEICKIFCVPPSIINGGAGELDRIEFINNCIIPVLSALECALNRDFLLESEKDSLFFIADLSELERGDVKTRFESYAIASRNGFMQIDEIRRKENLKPLGLDFVRLGLQDIFYDPATKEFYTPNMNQTGKLGRR